MHLTHLRSRTDLKLLTRYTLKEFFPPFFLALLCFTSILLLDEIFRLTKLFVQKGISPRYLIELLVYVLPATIVVTLPMSVLVGILLALGRFSTDNEITAMKAHGVGFHQILIPLLLMAILLSLVDLGFMDYALPRGNVAYLALKRDISRRNPAFVFEEGVIMKELEREGKLWMYEDIDEKTKHLQNVKVWDSIWSGRPRLIRADEAIIDFEAGQAWLKLNNGVTYESVQGDAEGFRVTTFEKQKIALNFTETLERTEFESKRPRSMKISRLKAHIEDLEGRVNLSPDDTFLPGQLRRAKVEYHKKFALPFACLAFGLIGVPLGLMVKRSGKMVGAGIGLMLILIYYLLLQFGQEAGRNEALPPSFAMWIPNIVIGLLGLGFNAHTMLSGRLKARRFRHKQSRLESDTAASSVEIEDGSSLVKSESAQASGKSPSRGVTKGVDLSQVGFRILDRYILVEYLRTFVLVLVFLMALVVIVRFLDKDVKRFDDDIAYWTAVQIVLYQAPRRIMEVVPIAGFIAVFFLLGRMVRNNELAAMKAAGVSVYRVVTPILIATLLICGLFAGFYDQVAAPAYHRAAQLKRKVPFRRYRNVVFKGQDNRLFYIQNLNLKDNTIERMTIYEFDAVDNLRHLIFADSATWTSNQWDLVNGSVRRFDHGTEVYFEPFETKQFERAEDPEQIAGSDKDLRSMTIKELREQIAYKRRAGQATRREQVKMHHQMAYPFAAFVVVLIGASIAIRFGKAGFFAGLVIAFLLSFIYWGLSFATLEGLSENGKLHPFIACWGANVLYGIVGGILLWRTPK